MPLYVRNLALMLDDPEDALVARAAKRLRVSVEDIRRCSPVRRSIDARRGYDPRFIYDVELTLTGGPAREQKLVRRLRRADVAMARPARSVMLEPGTEALLQRPVIVGFGPAGMFAALLLAETGYAPLVLERGQDVQRRHAHVLRDYFREGRFNPESNLLFGEGGAGAYSDGKLYTRVNDPRGRFVLETLVRFGADPDVLVAGRPHIGSDKLPGICRRMRLKIEEAGGTVRFGARVDGFEIEADKLTALRLGNERIAVGPVILAIGHSARDTIRRLAACGVQIAAKPFQLGLRIEHPQEMVSRWQYGACWSHPRLPAAEYHLVAKKAVGERGDLFSFCMCPGGVVLPSNESAGQVVTNGASRSRRGGRFANSALVVTLDPRAVSDDPLAGLSFQEKWEQAAFEMTRRTYKVPAQRACDLRGQRRSEGRLDISYPLGGEWADVAGVVPAFVVEAIVNALDVFDHRMPGFGGGDAIVMGPETRASAPIRIVRNAATRESLSTHNLFPVGEGAGYAGGIVSAAIDGIRSAETIISRFAPAR